MAQTQADVSLLIGAVGGYSANGASGKLIEAQLKSQLKNGLQVRINTQKIVTDLQKALSQHTFSAKVKFQTTGASAVNLGGTSSATTKTTSATTASTKATNQEFEKITKNIGNAYASLQRFNTYVGKLDTAPLTQFSGQISNIKSLFTAATQTGDLAKLQQATAEFKKLQYDINNSFGNNAFFAQQNKGFADMQKNIASAQSQLASFNQYLQRVKPTGLSAYSSEISNIRTLLAEAVSTGDISKLNQANNAIKSLKSQFVTLGHEGGNAFTYLKDKLKTFSVYLLSSTIAFRFISGIRNTISTVYDLDEALTNLRIVMNSSEQDAKQLLYTYNQMAQELGSTTKAVADAAVEWQRQGYSLAETNTLIKDSMILSITGFIDSSEAATALTSAMKGYQVSVDDALGVVDKFVAVDQVAATSAGNLAIALSKTAANAKLAGLSLDEVIGQLAVVNEVMQEAPESTGTFYNTLLSRMGMVKAGRMEDPETGESLSDVETSLAHVGVYLRDSNSEFRDFGEVLNEIGTNWDNYNTVQQRTIATALAGTRMQTKFISLMSNWNTALEYTAVAAGSAGTALDKFSVYEESLEAKTNRATAAFENMAMSLLPSGVIGGVLEFGTQIFNLGAALGGLPITILSVITATAALSAAWKAIKASAFGSSIKNTVTSITTLIPTLNAAGIASQAFAAGQTTAAVSSENLKAALATLTPAKIANIAATQKLTEAELKAILVSAGITGEKEKQILETYQLITAKKAETVATVTGTKATLTFKNALVGLGTVIKAHPFIFFLTTITTLIPLITGLFDSFNKSLEEMQEEYDQTVSSIDELNQKLEETKARIEEINGLEHITTVEQEELNRLKQYNEYLEDRLYLLGQEQEQQANEINSTAKSLYDEWNTSSNYILDENAMPVAMTGEEYYNYMLDQYLRYLEERNRITKEYSEGLIDSSVYESQIAQNEENIKKAEEYIQNTAKNFSDFAELLQDINGDYGEYNDEYSKWIELAAKGVDLLTQDKSAKLSASVEDLLNSDEFSGLKQWFADLAAQGKLTGETLNSVRYEDFIDALEKAGVVAKSSSSDMDDLAIVIERIITATDDATESTSDLSAQIETFGNATDKISKIYSLLNELEENETGQLKSEFLSELYELLPEVAGQIISVSDAQNALTQALDETKGVAENAYGIMLLSNQKWVEGVINNSKSLQTALITCYKNDANNWVDLATNKWTVDSNLISKLSTLWQKYYNVSSEVLAADIANLERIRDTVSGLSNLGPVLGVGFQAIGTTLDGTINELKLIQSLRQEIDFTFDGIDFTPSSSDTKKTEKAANAIENYTVSIDDFREALKKLKDVEDDINIEKIKIDMIDEDDVEAQKKATTSLIGLLKQEQAELHNLNNERDSFILDAVDELNRYGLGATYDPTTNDFWVSDIEKINTVKAYKNGVFDQEATNTLRKTLEDLIQKAQDYADSNIEDSEKWWDIQKEIYDLNKQIYESDQQIYEQRMETMQKSYDMLNDLVELEKDRIKQAGEDMIDSLQAEIDAYDEIINRQKESLELREREKSYEEEVSDAVDEIAKLQAQADALALDDSRSAQMQRAEILEQIAEKQKELEKTQHDYAIDNTQDALDEELDNFKDHYQERIDEIQEFLDDEKRLTDLAYHNIEQGGQETFNKLLEYCLKYTDISKRELTDMWTNAIAQAKEYGSIANALHGMSTEIDIYENGTPVSAQSTVDQMKENSKKWNSSNAAERERLQQENERLAKELSELLGVPVVRGNDGRWYYGKVGGTPVFHTGGIVGGASTLKQKELMVLAEKGEMMLNKKQQDNIASLLSVAFNRPDCSNMYGKILKNNEDTNSRIVSIDASVTVQGGMVDDVVLQTITNNQRKIANILNKLVLKK